MLIDATKFGYVMLTKHHYAGQRMCVIANRIEMYRMSNGYWWPVEKEGQA